MRKFVLNLMPFVRSMRLYQWVKNMFIFAPMVFSLQFFQLPFIVNSVLAFVLFSMTTGSIYIFNDVFDREKDRLHPQKCARPIASGRLSVPAAVTGAIIMAVFALTAIYIMNTVFFIIALTYMAMNLLYSSVLKKVVILDVMVIAAGFVMRVLIGGSINHIELSAWIIMITFLLAIFLGLIKRRQELVNLSAQNGNGGLETRGTLKKYNLPLLDQLISITTATTLICYIVYVINPDIQHKFQTKNLFLTTPFVVFGLFRYLYLTYSEGKGESPSEILFTDLPFTLNIILWVIVFIAIIFYYL